MTENQVIEKKASPMGKSVICAFVFSEIVGFADLSPKQRTKRLNNLSKIVHDIPVIATATDQEDILLSQTDDGIAIVFFNSPENALLCGVFLHREIDEYNYERKDEFHINLRTGINLGTVYRMEDSFTGKLRVVGNGMNMSQRTMSFGYINHLLVSRPFHKMIAPVKEIYNDIFFPCGIYLDKHGKEHEIYNACMKDLGNHVVPTDNKLNQDYVDSKIESDIESYRIIQEEIKTEVCGVLFSDIVSFSKLSNLQQQIVISTLNRIVHELPVVINEDPENVILRSTGDGVMVAFFGTPENALSGAIDIQEAINDYNNSVSEDKQLFLKIGVHIGLVERGVDIDGNRDVTGSAKDFAKLVMEFGDKAHVLTTRSTFELLTGLDNTFEPYFKYCGVYMDKAGLTHQIYTAVKDDIGNPNPPTKGKIQGAASSVLDNKELESMVKDSFPTPIALAYELYAEAYIESFIKGQEHWGATYDTQKYLLKTIITYCGIMTITEYLQRQSDSSHPPIKLNHLKQPNLSSWLETIKEISELQIEESMEPEWLRLFRLDDDQSFLPTVTKLVTNLEADSEALSPEEEQSIVETNKHLFINLFKSLVFLTRFVPIFVREKKSGGFFGLELKGTETPKEITELPLVPRANVFIFYVNSDKFIYLTPFLQFSAPDILSHHEIVLYEQDAGNNNSHFFNAHHKQLVIDRKISFLDKPHLIVNRRIEPAYLKDGDYVFVPEHSTFDVILELRNRANVAAESLQIEEYFHPEFEFVQGDYYWTGSLTKNQTLELKYTLKAKVSGKFEFLPPDINYIDPTIGTRQFPKIPIKSDQVVVEKETSLELAIKRSFSSTLVKTREYLTIDVEVSNLSNQPAYGFDLSFPIPTAFKLLTDPNEFFVEILKPYQTINKSFEFKAVNYEKAIFKAQAVPYFDKTANEHYLQYESQTIYVEFNTQAPMVGRENDLEILKTAFLKLPSGDGSTIFISGEAGIGKSRLVSALIRFARENDPGITVYQSECEKFLTHIVPLSPFKDMAKMIVNERLKEGQELNFTTLGRILHNINRDLVHYVETIGVGLLGLHVEEGTEVEFEREKLFYAFKSLLEGIVKHHPLIFYIDDIQWADQATMDLWLYLANTMEQLPVFFICTFRHEEQQTQLSKTMRLLSRNPNYQHVPLKRLNQHYTKLIFDEIFPLNAFTEEFYKTVHQETEGNPFYIGEVVTSMIQQQIIGQTRGAWTLLKPIANFQMPKNIENLILEKISHFDDDKLDVLRSASVIGREFKLDVWKEILASDLAIQVDDYIDEFVDLKLLHEKTKDTLEFNHIKIQEVLYQNIVSDRKRRQIHGKVAEVLEARYGSQPENYGLVSHHLYHGGLWEQAFPYLFKFGEQLMTASADKEAIETYQRAIESLEHLPIEKQKNLQAFNVLKNLGDIYQRQSEWPSADECFQKAFKLIEELAPTSVKMGWILHRLGKINHLRGNAANAQEYLSKSIAIAKDKNYRLLLAEVLKDTGNFHSENGAWEKAIEHYNESQEICKEINHNKLLYQLSIKIAQVFYHMSEWDYALTLLFKSEQQYQEINDPWHLSIIYRLIGNIYRIQGEYDKTTIYYEKQKQISIKIGDEQSLGTYYYNYGNMLFDRKDHEQALQFYEQAKEIYEKLGDYSGLAYVYNNMGEILKGKNNLDKALEFYTKSLKMGEELQNINLISYGFINLGETYQLKGELETALNFYQKALEQKSDDQSVMAWIYNCMGTIYKQQGDFDKALEYFEASRTISERLSGNVSGMHYLLPVYENIAAIYVETSDYGKASGFYEKGIEVAQKLGDSAAIDRLTNQLNDMALLDKYYEEPTESTS